MPLNDCGQSFKKSSDTNKVKRLTLIAILIASASALQLLESPLPRFFPWIKIGLANVITLYAVMRLSGLVAVSIAAMRTCLTAFFIGSLFSPIHIISFAGSVTAAFIMVLMHSISPKSSISFLSIFGAISNNMAQLIVVEIMFASNLSLWFHIALIIWVGIPAGILVGRITYELLRRT